MPGKSLSRTESILAKQNPSFSQRLRHRLARAWSGPPGISFEDRLEWRFTIVRFSGILWLAPSLLLFGFPRQRLLFSYGLLTIILIWNLGLQSLLRRRSSWLKHGYLTTIGDAVLCITMVILGGGFSSSFYYLVYIATVAPAMRFGYGPSLLVAGLYIALDAIDVSLNSSGRPDALATFVLRSGFLAITAVLASYLREQAQLAEAALAKQLARARALNESTRVLSASLQLDTVVRTMASEVRELGQSEAAAVRLGPLTSGPAIYDVATSISQGPVYAERTVALQKLMQDEGDTSEPYASQTGITDDGRWYAYLPLPVRRGMPGRIGLIRPVGAAPFELPDLEILSSFIDRATLAIENASLYKTNADRSEALQRAYADLASAHQELLGVDEMKTNFVANVSHEIRTPLTSIRSFSEILLSFDVDDETKREFLTIINTESERLTRLINDVLDITKIEAGHVEWKMVDLDLSVLLQQAVRSITTLAEAKGIHVDLEQPDATFLVHVDQDRILQVLSNLLGNAIKFTPHGAVQLSATAVGSEVHVQVRDTGIGIPLLDLERIFDKFHQVGDTLTDKPAGTGLGLSISRDIVATHGGKVWVESELGQGSTFSFSLPLIVDTKTASAALEAPQAVSRS